MGSGTYYAVGWGCAALPPLGDEGRQLFEIFEEHGIQTSYEGASAYAVIPLLSTLEIGRHTPDRGIPSGVMPLEELVEAIKKKVSVKRVDQTAKTWRAVQAAAAVLDVPVNLPDGRLLWFCDHE
jgi:hypothetical protein